MCALTNRHVPRLQLRKSFSKALQILELSTLRAGRVRHFAVTFQWAKENGNLSLLVLRCLNSCLSSRHWRFLCSGCQCEYKVSTMNRLAFPVLSLILSWSSSSYEIICGLVASSRVSGYFCWFPSRLRPLFSFWSPARVCISCQFMRTMHEFPWRKWLLCSSEKRNGVLCIRGPPKQHSSPYAAITRRCHRLTWYTMVMKTNAATKGRILQWPHCLERKGRTRLIWSGLVAFVRCRLFYLGG